jgi:hypothetical protein
MKILSLVLILAFTVSAAFANDNDDDAVHVNLDGGPATVTQDIDVRIPTRFALHITDTAWNLNLSVPAAIDEYCRFVSKAATLGTHPPNALSLITAAASGTLSQVTEDADGFGYPAIRPEAVTANHITNTDKGYLFCVNSKIVQKFANVVGWRLTIRLDHAVGTPATGFGAFAIADRFRLPSDHPPTAWRLHPAATTVAGGIFPLVTVPMKDFTTQGWLNNYITEGFFFDGSELAGNYDLVVTYTLAGY